MTNESVEALARRVLEVLAVRGESLATAESLTGGLLSARLTDVPGASRSFVGGVVSYATRVKESLLGVPADVVAQHGVVSGPCAEAMATGVRARLEATWGIATTGVAGPDAQEGKPVGTVWVAVAGPDGAAVRRLALDGSRARIREASCREVLALLAGALEEDPAAEPPVPAREEPGLG